MTWVVKVGERYLRFGSRPNEPAFVSATTQARAERFVIRRIAKIAARMVRGRIVRLKPARRAKKGGKHG